MELSFILKVLFVYLYIATILTGWIHEKLTAPRVAPIHLQLLFFICLPKDLVIVVASMDKVQRSVRTIVQYVYV